MICLDTFTKPSHKICDTPELIENYDKAIADTTQTWQCHHRLETHNSDGERRLVDITAKELKALGMYYNRPPEELIFLTVSEHRKLHQIGKPAPMKGHKQSKKAIETAKAIHKGNKYALGYKHTEEAKRKISEAGKGNKANSGMHWFTNGKENRMCFTCPEGYVLGMTRGIKSSN